MIVEPVSVASSQIAGQADGSLPRVNWPEGVPVPLDPGRRSGSSDQAWVIAAVIAVLVIAVIIIVVIVNGSSSPYGMAPGLGPDLAWIEPTVASWM
jgi:hypothetical protein